LQSFHKEEKVGSYNPVVSIQLKTQWINNPHTKKTSKVTH